MKKVLFLISFLIPLFSFIGFAQDVSGIYSDAMDAYHSADYSRAHDLFEKVLSGPSIPDELYATAKYYSADALLNLGQKNAAATKFEYLIKNFKWSAFRDKALYKIGMIYYAQEDYSTCRYYLTQLLDEYPESEYDGSALYWIGESFSKEKRFNDAISFLKQAINSPKNNKFVDYSIYTLANTYEKVGDYKNAVKYYDQLLSFHRDSKLVTAAQIRIGISYFKLKDYQSSIVELNNPMVTSLPDDQYAESLYLLANSYYRVSDYTNAEKTYQTVINDFPGSPVIREVKYGLAWSYFQQKKYDKSYNLFNSISEGRDSIAIKSFYWKAESKRYAGQEADAFNIYKEFLLKFPNSDLSYGIQYQLGLGYFNDKKYNLSLKFLTTALQASDQDIKAKALTLIAEMNLEMKNYDSAIEKFRVVLNLNDISENLKKRALLGLGSASFYSQKYDDAISYLVKLNDEDPDFETAKTNFFLAESYFSNSNYNGALKFYNRVSGDDKELNAEALYGRAYCYYNLGDYQNAADKFSNFLKNYPNNSRSVDSRLRLADSYYGMKNYSSSSRVFKDLLSFDKSSLKNPDTYYQYAQTLYKSGETREAISEFNNLQRKFPRSNYADKSLYIIGWIYFQQNNFDQAIRSYENVLEKYPNSNLGPTIYYSIGDCYFNQGKYDSAIVSYQTVLVDYPTSSHVFDAVNGIQYSYIAKNEPEKAIDLIDQFVQQNPGLKFADQIYFKKGGIYYGLHEYEKSEESYKDFITKFPESKQIPDAYYWIGKSAENLKQNDEAIFNFNRIFENYPTSEFAGASVIEMGNIYNELKRYDEGIQILDRALDKLSGSQRLPEIEFLKGVTYSNKNDVTNAYDTFNQVLTNYPSSIFADKAKFELGLIELAAKRYENATQYFQDLANKRTDDLGAKAQYYLGEVYFDQDKITDAISAFVRVRTVFPAYDEWLTRAFLRLGDSYLKLKDPRQAKEMYRTVLSKHKGDEFGKEAASKLRKVK
ncbi:MAG: tetratricopeptide repeat protein [Ignavibacteriaceae bacterium]